MKVTLALQQGGLKSLCVVFTWPCGELKKHKDTVRLQHSELEILHFMLLEPGRGEIWWFHPCVSSMWLAYEGRTNWELQKMQRKWGTSPEWGGEMSPVLSPRYRLVCTMGWLKKAMIESRNTCLFCFYSSWLFWMLIIFFNFFLEAFVWVFLLVFFIVVKQLEFVVSLTESTVSSLRLK